MTTGTLRSMHTPVAPVIADPESWIEEAACREVGPGPWDTFGGEMSVENRRALGICRSCPVHLLCRDFADRTEPPRLAFNIFGGETPAQRIARRNKDLGECSRCGKERAWSAYEEIRSSGMCWTCWTAHHPQEWNRIRGKVVAA